MNLQNAPFNFITFLQMAYQFSVEPATDRSLGHVGVPDFGSNGSGGAEHHPRFVAGTQITQHVQAIHPSVPYSFAA